MIKKLNYIFTKKEKIRLAGVFLLILIGSFMELLGVSVFLPFIQVLMEPEMVQSEVSLRRIYEMFHFQSTDQFLIALGGMICIVYILKNSYLIMMQNAMLKFSYKTRMQLATKLLSTYMAEPYTFHLNRNISELQRSLQYDTGQFMQLINASLQVLAEIAVVMCLGVYLFYTSPTISIVILGLVVICVGFFTLLSRKYSRRIGKQNEAYNAQLYQWINQSLGGIKEVKVLNRESFFVDSYKDVYKKLIKGAKNNEMLATIPKYILETVCIVGMIIAVIVKLLWGRRDLTAFVVQMSAFAVASFRLLPSVGKINAYVNSIMYCRPALDLIYDDLKAIEDFVPEEQEEIKHKVETWHLKEKIELQNISYTYDDADKEVLSNIELTIHKGETIALIGSSGAGKTTLADVFLGLLIPQKGHILVDGKNIYDHMDSWHHMLGYIPQSIYLSDDTIRNNVAFGIRDEDIDDAAVEEALKKAQLYDFVQTLDKGMNTFVGDRGVRLSGGQRQRIGIARALYFDPEILVLDEATSALDNETETAVMEAIESLKGLKTMVIIAHRLTTIRNADKIYEVTEGQAVLRRKEDVL
ncbi:MAG: ABC transporter ATP-binding protein/permease [Lachnospiraceae bacterium]|nr:ABC transporter ATP-binding protein/permease [Lachnospiraceae bacterium]